MNFLERSIKYFHLKINMFNSTHHHYHNEPHYHFQDKESAVAFAKELAERLNNQKTENNLTAGYNGQENKQETDKGTENNES